MSATTGPQRLLRPRLAAPTTARQALRVGLLLLAGSLTVTVIGGLFTKAVMPGAVRVVVRAGHQRLEVLGASARPADPPPTAGVGSEPTRVRGPGAARHDMAAASVTYSHSWRGMTQCHVA